MRWSRFSGSTASILPVTAQIELRGIPAHAWELDTMAQLLNEWCLPCGVLLETEGQRSSFHLTTWCSNPCTIPLIMDLEIPEPEVSSGRFAQERHCQRYPISISVVPLGGLAE